MSITSPCVIRCQRQQAPKGSMDMVRQLRWSKGLKSYDLRVSCGMEVVLPSWQSDLPMFRGRMHMKEGGAIMPTQKKIEKVAEIETNLGEYAGFFVVDYRGLTVKQINALRKELRGVDARCTVYKNNLVRIALNNAELPDMGDMLDGPNALVFFREDPASAGKIIKNFAKENKALELKGGMIDKAVADTAMANAIADLPTREELLSTVLATMLNPMSQIARVVDLIREQKESEAA